MELRSLLKKIKVSLRKLEAKKRHESVEFTASQFELLERKKLGIPIKAFQL